MLIAGLVKMLPTPKSSPIPEADARYDQLVHNLFRPSEPKGREGKLIAFTSPAPKAGVSYVVNEIGLSLTQYGDKRALVVDAARLQGMCKSEMEELIPHFSSDSNLSLMTSVGEKNISSALGDEGKTAHWRQRQGYQVECLQALRNYFDYVLIDCQSLKTSSDAILLSKLVDGIVMVVAAEKTKRDEIRHGQRMIEMAEGKFLGFVLNQRKYHIPDWLYRRL